MVDHPGTAPVGDADQPRYEVGPAALDLPVEVRTFQGWHGQIAQDEVEVGLLCENAKRGGAGVDPLHVEVTCCPEPISYERPHLLVAVDHQDARWPGASLLAGRADGVFS